MGLSTSEKLVHVALVLAVAGIYLSLGRGRIRSAGGWSHVLRLREPAILVDSARVVIALLWLPLTPDLVELARLIHSGVLVDSRTVLGRLFDLSQVDPDVVVISVYVYRVAMVLFALGVLTRVTAAVSLVTYTFAWSVAYAFTHAAHNHVVAMVLLIFMLNPERSCRVWKYVAAARAGQPLTAVASVPSYFRIAVMAPVVTAYFQGGIEKLIRSGSSWMNGYTLQGHLQRVGSDLGEQLATQDHSLLIVLSTAILLWELCFGFVILFPRLRLFGVLSLKHPLI